MSFPLHYTNKTKTLLIVKVSYDLIWIFHLSFFSWTSGPNEQYTKVKTISRDLCLFLHLCHNIFKYLYFGLIFGLQLMQLNRLNLEHKLPCSFITRNTRDLFKTGSMSREPNQFYVLKYVAHMSMTLISIYSFQMHKDVKNVRE